MDAQTGSKFERCLLNENFTGKSMPGFYWATGYELNMDSLLVCRGFEQQSMSDLEFRVIEVVVHSHCGPGINQFRDGTAPLQRAPPVGSTRELHLHQQLVVFQRDQDRGSAEGWGGERREGGC